MEGIIIAFIAGFVVCWFATLNERLTLRQYRRRERWLPAGIRSVEPGRR